MNKERSSAISNSALPVWRLQRARGSDEKCFVPWPPGLDANRFPRGSVSVARLSRANVESGRWIDVDNENPEVGSPELTPETAPEAAPASRWNKKAMWLAMGSVAVALAALIFAPGPGFYDDDAPPPAQSSAGEGGGADVAPVFKDAPLQFTLKDMNGVDVNLASFKGKVILLNFWATWCGPCREEIPSLVELQTQYGDDLVVLGFSVDDTVEKLRPYAEQFKMNYPVLVGNGRDDVQEAYGPIWGIPISVIIGRDGKIHKKHSGIASKDQFEREIKELL